jgi:hypothetical protein
MAAAHPTVKIRSGRNPAPKTETPKTPKRAKTAAQRRKIRSVSTPPAQGPITARTPGSEVAVRGARIRVRGRLQDMIRTEMLNLEKAASVLRCLVLSMDTQLEDGEPPYYPDVVEVAGDLIERSLADLDVLYDGYLPNPLLAGRKIERL